MKRLITFLPILIALSAFAQFERMNEITDFALQLRNIKPADLDNDGDLDVIVVANADNQIGWIENEGGNSFGPFREIGVAQQGIEVSSGDIDGDGDIDVIACTAFLGEVLWYENSGNGDFIQSHVVATGFNQVFSIDCKDVNNDNMPDIVILRNPNVLSWFENTANGIFSSENIIANLNSSGRKIILNDLDQDGDEDIIVGYQHVFSDYLSIFENISPGNFGVELVVSTAQRGISDIKCNDIDNDGDDDIICASKNNANKLVWYENQGSLSFTQHFITDTIGNYSSIYINDLNNDGDSDIVVSVTGVTSGLYWTENLGGGIFSQFTPFTNSGNLTISCIAEDFNQDGDVDVMVGHNGGSGFLNITYHENQGSATFLPEKIIDRGIDRVMFVRSGDIDGDGDNDILAGSSTENILFWYENYGNNRYSFYKNIEVIIGLKNGDLVDIDNDGDMDIITTSSSNLVRLHENIGGGVFNSGIGIFLNGSSGAEVSGVDIDGDGLKDIVGSSGAEVAWSKNLGGGNWAPKQIITTTVTSYLHCVDDMDNDGDNDLVVTARTLNKVSYFENLGAGIFGPEQIINQNLIWAGRVSTGDVDGDGIKDILAISTTNSKQVWFRNLGANVFDTTQYIIGNESNPSKIMMYDINGDNLKDIVYSYSSLGSVDWKENLGGGNYTIAKTIGVAGDDDFVFSDMDNSGIKDLVMLYSGALTTSRIQIYKNHYNSNYQMRGRYYFDANQNANRDSNELGLSGVQTSIQPVSAYSFSTQDGSYFHSVDSGTYTVAYLPVNYWGLSSDSASYTRLINSVSSVADSLDFGFYPDTILTKIVPDLTGGFPRCNDTINYWVSISNIGTTISSGVIELILDDSLTYISSTPVADSIVNGSIFWGYDSLLFFDNQLINLQLVTPSFLSMGDTLISELNVIDLDSLGNPTITFSDTLEQLLLCGYDPNDKSVDPTGYDPEGYIANNQDLKYLIRFQNTGTDTAFNIMITDQLSANLNWSTLHVIARSHDVITTISQNGVVKFRFNNILLPDSGSDFLSSQGFVKFAIELKSGLAPHTRINNHAKIFFDQNPAVITNNVLNTIECYTAPLPVISFTFPYLNAGVTGNYTYQWYLNDTILIGATLDTLTPLISGSFTVEITDSNSCSKTSLPYIYFPVGIEEFFQLKSVVFPNPFNESSTILFDKNLNGEYDLLVYDLVGKVVKRINRVLGNKVEINKNDVGKGMFLVYLINSKTGEKFFIEKVIRQ